MGSEALRPRTFRCRRGSVQTETIKMQKPPDAAAEHLPEISFVPLGRENAATEEEIKSDAERRVRRRKCMRTRMQAAHRYRDVPLHAQPAPTLEKWRYGACTGA